MWWGRRPLMEVGYQQVTLKSAPHLAQLENTQGILMGISNDSLLKPLREMAGVAGAGGGYWGMVFLSEGLMTFARIRWDLRRAVIMGSGFQRWRETMG